MVPVAFSADICWEVTLSAILHTISIISKVNQFYICANLKNFVHYP